MAIPKLLLLHDLPDYHILNQLDLPECRKIILFNVDGHSENKRCGTQAVGCIQWRFYDDTEENRYYCLDHLPEQVDDAFLGEMVTIEGEKGEWKYEKERMMRDMIFHDYLPEFKVKE